MSFRTIRMHTTRWGLVTGAASIAALLCLGANVPSAATGATQARSSIAPAGDVVVRSNFSDGKWGDPTADSLSKDAYGRNAAEKDPGSLYTVEKAISARVLWTKKDAQGRPVTGEGVGVAVLDSGITQVPGLDAPGKVTFGPDLSIEANGGLAYQDTFGHGTFMAGIIGGRGASNPSADLASAPANIQLGVAPDAKLLAMKLATTDGSTDVSQVIAALDWVVQHPVMSDGTRIRVINLSYGTDSAQPYQQDPLAAAAENAWKHGIVVVTSAGNSGASSGRVTDPASDPYVLAVGAADSGERTNGWTREHTRAAAFSNVSTSGRHADVLVPGTSLVSLRAAGSNIDANHPEGRVAGDPTGRLFRGSGTSQAAAVVSGAVADLLQAFPTLTPDQVKYALTSTAQSVPASTPAAAGFGVINLQSAYDSASHLLGADDKARTMRAAAVQSFPQATGDGSIDAARGGSVLVDADGNALTGELDVQGNPWNAGSWWQHSSTATTWSGGRWLGTTWAGDGWETTGLSSARWSSARWSSARWSDAEWSSARWSSARWSSARWSSARWSSEHWSANSW
jgi:serine protease AprX